MLQKRFVNELTRSKSAAQAARKAGYSPNSARFIASENLTKHNIQEAIRASLRGIGFDETFISERLKTIVDYGTSERALKQATVRDANRSLELGAGLYGLLNKHTENSTLVLKSELASKTVAQLQEELIRLRAEEEKFL